VTLHSKGKLPQFKNMRQFKNRNTLVTERTSDVHKQQLRRPTDATNKSRKASIYIVHEPKQRLTLPADIAIATRALVGCDESTTRCGVEDPN
jgi:hypothetical protein